ncbi:serine/threonine-protein phosphatase 7 long form homolog [Arachis hypogaea]|uniref:serine/threonine-protein phosphatase 7 long form homolog n=1 Tax=Arachis hypogaea TaxID=3818 RepID=UPI003B21C7D1
MLTCNHPVPPNRYNDRVEEHLRITGFYHVSQIGIVQCQKALVNVLIECWHPDTHTFHFPIGECSMTLEDVALIFGLPTDGLPVTRMIMSSFEAMEVECLLQFGVAPCKEDCRSNFLPLLRDFVNIGQFSWGSACLAHLYRALCRASRYNCKKIDGPLTLLLGWAWIRLPYLSPLPREPRSFPLANRWRNWERGDRRYRYLKLAHFRKALMNFRKASLSGLPMLWIVWIRT